MSLILGLVVIGFVCYLPTTSFRQNAVESTATAAQTPDSSPRHVLEAGVHQTLISKLFFTADGREQVSVNDDKTTRDWSVSPEGRKAALMLTTRGQIEDGRAGRILTAALSPSHARGRQCGLVVGGYLGGQPKDCNAICLHDYASSKVRP